MNIACDIRVFIAAETGIGNYYRNLLYYLARIDKQNTYFLFSSSLKQRFPLNRLPSFAKRRFSDQRIPVRVLNYFWQRFSLPSVDLFFREKIELSHSPVPFLLPCTGKKIVTLHDLFFLDSPSQAQPETRQFSPQLLRSHLERADGIICASHDACNRLLDRWPINANKCRVIRHGLHPVFFPPLNQISVARERLFLPEAYALVSGTIEPRKNLPMLLRLLVRLRHRGIKIPLVIAGKPGWEKEEYQALRKELGAQVIETGYVEIDELSRLYRGARFLVFPSLAEGFGFPLLEGLASGIPVLCSDLQVFHEIGSDFPLFFDLNRPDDLEDKFLKLWLNPEYPRREEAREYALSFTWELCASQTLDFYREVARENA